jgi:rhodanese-related sulfurtransferase
MIGTIKQLLGFGPKVDLQELLNQGGIIVDVRSKAEFLGGHIKNSINIPVDQLSAHLKKLPNKETPIITCCASGMRSAAAKSMLKKAGYSQVHNGGSWRSLTHLETK